MNALDILLVELWDKGEKYKKITDNLGIACLKASLDMHSKLSTGMLNSHRLYFYEAIDREPLDVVLAYISAFHALNRELILGISSTQWRLADLRELVTEVHARYPNMSVIAGGYGPTFLPCEVLDFGVDAVCIGEGDETIVDLVDALGGQTDLSQVRGIAYYRNGSPEFTPQRSLVDVRKLPPPSLDYVNGRTLCANEYTYANRGCCYQCDFCFIHRFYKMGNGRPWRAKSATQIYSEYRIRRLRNPELQVIGHSDDNFIVSSGFLEELRYLVKNDPVTSDLLISFPAGACEINQHWANIEKSIDIVKYIEFGYESRVPAFLKRQKKGRTTLDMSVENRTAIIRLQEARSAYERFDYEIFHITGDRHTSIEELKQIYPKGDSFDKVEWAIKVLRNGPSLILYFDERDHTYPLFIHAYTCVYDELCRFYSLLNWLSDSIEGRYRHDLEIAIERSFHNAFRAAEVVHNRYSDQRGGFEDIDPELRKELYELMRQQGIQMHAVISEFITNLANSMLLSSSIHSLIQKPWFEGYATRLMDCFQDYNSISPPSYIKVFVRTFEKLEEHASVLTEPNLGPIPDDRKDSETLMKAVLVNILRNVVEIGKEAGFDDADQVQEALSDVSALVDDFADAFASM